MYLILLIVVSSETHGLSTIPKKEKKKAAVSKRAQISPKSNTDVSRLKRELNFYKKKSESLELMNNYRIEKPDIDDDFFHFVSGDLIGGYLQFALLSTNMDSPIVVIPELRANLPEGTKFLCSGSTKHKRVVANCYKAILNGETKEVNATVLSDDGSSGIRGDFYTGKEEYIAGMILSEATKGMLSLEQTRVNTALGQVTANSSKNAVLQALINSSDQANDLMREEMQTKEPKVFVKSKTRVILFIN